MRSLCSTNCFHMALFQVKLESKEFLASLEDLEMWEALVSEVCLERLVFLDHLVLLDHWAVLDRLEQLDSLEIVVRLVCGVSLDRLGLKALLDNQVSHILFIGCFHYY